MSTLDDILEKQELVVRRVSDEASAIRSYELALPDNRTLPPVEAGAHLAIHLGNGLTRQYSLYDTSNYGKAYYIAVLKDARSRGGSIYMHEKVQEGDTLTVSGPYNNFKISHNTSTALFIAGGIGITPLLSMARNLYEKGISFALYYCARNEKEAAFVEFLRDRAPFKDSVIMHFDDGDPEQALDVEALLAHPIEGRHLYYCGPGGLMDAIEAASSHWPKETVHCERFKADAIPTANDQAFTITLFKSQVELEVPADKTILTILKEHGYEVDTLCEEGVCGSCLTDVIEGIPEHRDQILTQDEKTANDVMTICCSRSKTPHLVLDL